jgi:hypothetical protein
MSCPYDDTSKIIELAPEASDELAKCPNLKLEMADGDMEDLLTDNNLSRSSDTEPSILPELGPQQSRRPQHAGVVPKFASRMLHSETYFKRMAAMVSSSSISPITVSQWLI